ncbi:MAG: ABC transporter ATP-binding protein [Chromatiales bacterium]|nr:ABC transporter ATP-binding protein [Chromatiales bacterium]
MDRGEDGPVTGAAPAGAGPAAGAPGYCRVAGVARSFGGVPAVRDVSLDLARGEILALLGPSGCGKSTLLRMVAGLEMPDRGAVFLDGEDITRLPPYRRPVNLMFQSYALFPHLTVAENVAFGLRQARRPPAEVEARVTEMLALVRMESFRQRRPAQLSGGQQQRVALARSLARSPKLLLLDEPMGALDRKLRAEMQFELAGILRRVGVTCMLVTHDPEEAMVMADRVALMRDGELAQVGTPAEVYDSPRDRFAAEFLGPVNLFGGTVVAGGGGGVLTVRVPDLGAEHPVPAPGPEQPGEGASVTVAIRPERLQLAAGDAAARGALAVEVAGRAFLGTHTVYRVRLPGGALATVQQPEDGSPPFEAGRPAYLTVDGAALRVLAD